MNNAHIKKKILLTGSTGGLGKQIARKCAAEGHDIILHARSRQKLDILAAELYQNTNKNFDMIIADLSTSNDLERMVNCINKKHKDIDVLINNAAKFETKSMLELTKKDIDESININVVSPTILAKLCVQQMSNRNSGLIINVGSSSAYGAAPNTSAYVISKHALLGLSRALKAEYSDAGISSIFVAPGSVQTEMGRQVKNQDFNTFINASELAELIVNLINEKRSYILNEVQVNRRTYR